MTAHTQLEFLYSTPDQNWGKPKSFPCSCIIFLKEYSSILSFWCKGWGGGDKKSSRASPKQHDIFGYSDFFF